MGRQCRLFTSNTESGHELSLVVTDLRAACAEVLQAKVWADEEGSKNGAKSWAELMSSMTRTECHL